METILGAGIGGLLLIIIIVIVIEYRFRQPDVLVLYEQKGQLGVRTGLVYPRHFSLVMKRTTHPIQLNISATATGNLGVNVKLAGSFVPALDHLQTLIRVGGWNSDALVHASDGACNLLEGLVKEYTERSEIHLLSSAGIVEFLNEHSDQVKEKFGVELIALVVQSLEATDTEVSDALRQQEQARLLEQTEALNHQARVSTAKAKYLADVEIVEMQHALELKKAELQKIMLDRESAMEQQRVEDDLKRSRLRLAFEKEELEILKDNPELLVLTPQAARLAEASQGLKNARTVISLTPQELAGGSELLNLFQVLLQKAIDAKKNEQ
jgi:hypothetical protein